MAPNPRAMPAKPVSSSLETGGAYRDRTDDLKLAKLALSQLSYGPIAMHRHESARTASKWWAE